MLVVNQFQTNVELILTRGFNLDQLHFTTLSLSCHAFLRAKLLESEAVSEGLRKSLSRASARSSLYGGPAPFSPAPDKEASDVIEMAKRDLERLKKKEKKKKKRYDVESDAFEETTKKKESEVNSEYHNCRGGSEEGSPVCCG